MEKLVKTGFIIILAALAVFIAVFLVWKPASSLDWLPIAYFLWQLLVFAVCFGTGYYFWKHATTSDWDARFRDLVRKVLVENPQIKSFGDRLDENKQWLMKRDTALDQFRKDYLAKSNQLLDGERKLAAAETGLMLKTGELNELKGILGEKSDLLAELHRRLAAARHALELKEDRLGRDRSRIPDYDSRLTDLERRASANEKALAVKREQAKALKPQVDSKRSQVGQAVEAEGTARRAAEDARQALQRADLTVNLANQAAAEAERDASDSERRISETRTAVAELDSLKARLAGAEAALNEIDAGLAGIEAEMGRKGRSLAEAQVKLDEVTVIKGFADRLSQINIALEEAQIDKADLDESLRQRRETSNLLRNRVGAAETTVAALNDKIRSKEAELQEKARALAKAKLDQEETLREIAAVSALADQLDDLDRQLAAAKEVERREKANLKNVQRIQGQRDKSLQQLKAKQSQSLDRHARLKTLADGLRLKLTSAERANAELEARLAGLGDSIARGDSRLEALRSEMSNQERNTAVLKEALAKVEGLWKSRNQRLNGLLKEITAKDRTLTGEPSELLIVLEDRRSKGEKNIKDLERRISTVERSATEKRDELGRLRADAMSKDAKIKEIQSKFSFVIGTVTERVEAGETVVVETTTETTTKKRSR